MHVGIDIEQFVHDPQSSGIQRVLQQLAIHWPTEAATAVFVAPHPRGHLLLSAEQAASLLSIPFEDRDPGGGLRARVRAHLDSLALDPVAPGTVLAMLDRWLLPEVSYLPSVLDRLETYAACMPATMIGFDALPMTDPENYRFAPGTASMVSRYFQRLADVDTVVCISQYARDRILTRLRRDPGMATTVAHPGGDHIPIDPGSAITPPRFVRLGTLEARKQPLEVLSAFRLATAEGLQAELVFVGAGSASDAGINAEVREAVTQGIGVRWIEGASDAEVRGLVREAAAFLSFGVEGYGIPVLEAIRLGTPVLFDGIQPAAELMLGRGAHRVDASTVRALAHDLQRTASGDLATLRASCVPAQVPRWRDFAERVAAATVG